MSVTLLLSFFLRFGLQDLMQKASKRPEEKVEEEAKSGQGGGGGSGQKPTIEPARATLCLYLN